MLLKITKVSSVAMTLVIIAAIIMLLPMKAQATSIPVLENMQILDGSVLMNGYADKVEDLVNGGWDWQYSYYFRAPEERLAYVNVGLGLPGTFQLYEVHANTTPVEATDPTRMTASSLKVYFNPDGLDPNTLVDFSITYDSFIDSQYISVTAMGSEKQSQTVQVTYSRDFESIPEPMTVLLLGCGLVILGLSRRRLCK